MAGKVSLLALALALGCTEYRPQGFREPLKLGDGTEIPAEVLTRGEILYAQYCRACHGEKGDGKGPAAARMRPPPRDFTLGSFKFASVPAGTLPLDEDLVRTVHFGLHGTPMRGWDGIPEQHVRTILQYVKTFSPRWKEEAPGEKIEPTPDPWREKSAEGVERGRALYHGLAQCLGCHPSYAPKPYIAKVSKELTGSEVTDFRDDMYGPELKESDYGVKILPPDFTRTELRSVRAEHRVDDLFRVISAGVGGTAMPTWHGSLPDEDLWALAHFVDSLVRMRGTDEPHRLLEANTRADAAWKPPKTGKGAR